MLIISSLGPGPWPQHTWRPNFYGLGLGLGTHGFGLGLGTHGLGLGLGTHGLGLGLGTHGFGLGLKGPGLGFRRDLESCTDNYVGIIVKLKTRNYC